MSYQRLFGFLAVGFSALGLIRRATDDAEIVNDPPDPNIGVVAVPATTPKVPVKLPSCGKAKASLRSFCKTISARDAAYIGAALRAAAVDDALRTTIFRLSGAAAGGDAAAATTQRSAYTALQGQLAAAEQAQDTAGASLAKAIRAAKVRGKLTTKQSAKAITRILDKLGKAGQSATTIRGLAAGPLTAGPVDALATLSGAA